MRCWHSALGQLPERLEQAAFHIAIYATQERHQHTVDALRQKVQLAEMLREADGTNRSNRTITEE